MYKTLLLSSAAAVAFGFGLAPVATFAQQDEQQQEMQQEEAEQQQAAQDEAAQQDELAEQADEEEQVAAACLDELQTTAQALAQEGYWITGWGQRWGWGMGPGGPGTGTAQDGGVPPAATGTVPDDQTAIREAPATDMPTGPAADPWGMGAMDGMASPRHQVRALFSAAHVFAYQGDQEGCEYVLARLHMTAEDHLDELREMGVDPQQVTDWRREAMAAVPLTQFEPAGIHIDNLTGADVRNLQDEYLGSVSDIILDVEEAAP